MKRFYLWLAVFLVPGVGAQEAVTQEEIRVVFRDIRVHVTDRKGNPISGLRPSDFVLREDGAVRQITFFDEVNGIKRHRETPNDALQPETPQEAQVNRFGEGSNIVIILDSSNMRMEAFPEFKEVIREFIEENIGPEHSVKLVQLENQLLHLSPFLNDKDALLAALDQAEYQGAQVTQLRRLERQVTHSFSYLLQPGLIQDAEEMDLERGNYLIPLKDAVRQKIQLKREFFINFEYSLRQLARILDQMTGSKSVYLFSGGGFVTSNNFMKPTKPLSNALGRTLNSANMTIYSFVHIPRRSLFDQFARQPIPLICAIRTTPSANWVLPISLQPRPFLKMKWIWSPDPTKRPPIPVALPRVSIDLVISKSRFASLTAAFSTTTGWDIPSKRPIKPPT